jgi:hypothetical protein
MCSPPNPPSDPPPCRDDLPYLIDLHLFLSRPLHSAPVRGLGEAAAAAEAARLAPGTSLLGAFPQVGAEGMGGCVCACVHMCVRAFACVCAWVNVCVCACVRMCVHACVCFASV